MYETRIDNRKLSRIFLCVGVHSLCFSLEVVVVLDGKRRYVNLTANKITIMVRYNSLVYNLRTMLFNMVFLTHHFQPVNTFPYGKQHSFVAFQTIFIFMAHCLLSS
jgi:hypothetical protein